MKILLYKKAYFSTIFLLLFSLQANSAIINFSGQLDVILEDSGGAVYSGTPIGTTFTGSIDDVTANGQISDGTTVTTFTCCTLAAGGLDVSNDDQLDAATATLLNTLAGSTLFSAGDFIDTVNIEGDATTASGGRIEVGLSYILNPSAFINDDPSNYPFNQNDLLLSLFFILEEDASGTNDIYDVVGALDAPASTSSDLSIVKTDSVDPVAPSGTLSYTLAVTNNGPADAANVVVEDTLPTGMVYVSGTTNAPGTSCAEAGGVVTCNLANIANSAAVTATIEVTAPAITGTVTNTASVSANEIDTNPANNSDSEDTTIGTSSTTSNDGGGSSLSPALLLLLGLPILLRSRRSWAQRYGKST